MPSARNAARRPRYPSVRLRDVRFFAAIVSGKNDTLPAPEPRSLAGFLLLLREKTVGLTGGIGLRTGYLPIFAQLFLVLVLYQ